MIVARILSLLPSSTEIICALGLSDRLVGRSHECDFPETVQSLPACTRPRLDANASGAQINTQVKALMEQAVSIYEIDVEKIRQLRPDLILTQAQCKVCAVSVEEVEQAIAGWTGRKPKLISLAPAKLSEVWDSIRHVAEAAGVEEKGREVLKGLKNRCVNIIEKTCSRRDRPSVGCIEWMEPLMAAGNWVPELVNLAGGRDVLGQAGKHSDWLKWEVLKEKNPDYLILMPCGFGLSRTLQEAETLKALPGWNDLKAVRNGCVYAVDGNQYFNRPGPRLVESLEILAEILYPKLFRFSHEGKGWKRV